MGYSSCRKDFMNCIILKVNTDCQSLVVEKSPLVRIRARPPAHVVRRRTSGGEETRALKSPLAKAVRRARSNGSKQFQRAQARADPMVAARRRYRNFETSDRKEEPQ
jgi:hypothetical protein